MHNSNLSNPNQSAYKTSVHGNHPSENYKLYSGFMDEGKVAALTVLYQSAAGLVSRT